MKATTTYYTDANLELIGIEVKTTFLGIVISKKSININNI